MSGKQNGTVEANNGETNLQTLLEMQEKHSKTPTGNPEDVVPVIEPDKPIDPSQRLIRADEEHRKAQAKEVQPAKKEKKVKKEEKKEEPVEEDPDFLDLSSLDDEPKEEPEIDEDDENEEDGFEPEENEESEQDLSKETNLKNLRGIAGKFKEEAKTLKARVSELETKIGQSDPAALQEEITKLRGRVKQLEPFEQVFALHQNPDFKARFIDGPGSLVSEMKEIAKDYNVEEAVISDLLSAQNRREIDEILDDAFAKDGPKNDVKALKQRWDSLMRQRKEIEKQPEKELQRLDSQKKLEDASRNKKRDLHIQEVLNFGWAAAIDAELSLPKEKRIQELREIPGKKDHNEKVVRPILAQAQSDLVTATKYIEQLVRNQAVPSQDFVYWLSRMAQKAAAFSSVYDSRTKLYARYKSLLDGKKKESSFSRPSIEAPSRNTPAPAPKKGLRSVEELITENFRQVKAESLKSAADD